MDIMRKVDFVHAKKINDVIRDLKLWWAHTRAFSMHILA